MDFVAATKTPLSDILSPRAEGEPVNTHVVERAAEPKPDFEKMQRVIQGLEEHPASSHPSERKS
jgi:hypothetical protein